MNKRYISLYLSGERFDYIYYPETRMVATQDFPDIPIVKVFSPCRKIFSHDTIRDTIEYKLKQYEDNLKQYENN